MRRQAASSFSVSVFTAVGLLVTLLLYRAVTRRFAPNETDSFFLALGILNVVMVPAFNAMTSSFVPAFVRRTVDGPGTATPLLGALLGWTTTATALSTILIASASIGLSTLFASPSASTVQFLRRDVLVLGPLVTLQAIGALLAAASQALGRYWLPAAAIVFQQSVVLAMISLRVPINDSSALPMAFTLGAAVNLVVLVGTWPWQTIPLTFSLRVQPELIAVVRTASPLLAGALAVQVGLVSLRLLASGLPSGTITAFDLAYRLSLAIVEVCSSGVLAVALTEWSGAIAQGRAETLGSRVQNTLALVLFVVLPLPLLVHALREPLFRLWLGSGPQQSLSTTTALIASILLLAVPIEVCGRLYTRLLLAQGLTRAQGWIYGMRAAVTLGVAVVLVRPLAARGLALAELIAVSLTLILLHRVATGRWSPVRGRAGWHPGLRIAGAGAAGWIAASLTTFAAGKQSPLFLSFAGCLVGLAAYVAVARALGAPELKTVVGVLRKSQQSERKPQAV